MQGLLQHLPVEMTLYSVVLSSSSRVAMLWMIQWFHLSNTPDLTRMYFCFTHVMMRQRGRSSGHLRSMENPDLTHIEQKREKEYSDL